ncbi:MAG: SCO family protein [Bdellovibrionales bacterium]
MLKKLLAVLFLATMALPASAQSIGGPFTLTGQNGKQVTEKTYRGKFMLIFFGCTRCTTTTAPALKKLSAAVAALGDKAAKVAPLFITVDAEGDKPATLSSYLSANAPNFTGLTGTRAQINAATNAYKVYALRVDDKGSIGGAEPEPDAYYYLHSDYVYLMSPQGTFYTLLQGSGTQEQLSMQLNALIK